MNPVLRAKISVNVQKSKDPNGNQTAEQINGTAVYSPDPESENGQFSLATPYLSLNMNINNPKAFDKLENGKEYYLDFIPVE